VYKTPIEQTEWMINAETADNHTTAGRIRDAAIVLSDVVGFGKATTRSLAKRAGVSLGLVLHHFCSKGELRAACDEYVIAGTPA
jgi:AcrR family transcriptional regulator